MTNILNPVYYRKFRHVLAYSEPCAMLAYAETWHTRNPGIFRTLPQLFPAHIQNPDIFKT